MSKWKGGPLCLSTISKNSNPVSFSICQSLMHINLKGIISFHCFCFIRLDHNLQDVRAKIFPYKRMKMKSPDVVTPVTLPAKRKERSLSSLVVSTPRVSSQSGMTGRRSKSVARKALRGSSFTIEKPMKKEDDSMEDHPESSSSPETLNKFSQTTRQVWYTALAFAFCCVLVWLFSATNIWHIYFNKYRYTV